MIVADDAGGLSAWFAYQHPGGKRLRLDRVHELRSHDSVVEQLAPSMRTKMLVSRDADGTVHVDHVTTQRPLLTLETDRPLVAVGLNDRADGLVGLDAGGQMLIWDLHVEHPEVAWSTYFGKVWYESYREPAYVWQSAGATDEFEPKLSLMPLIFGTLKGTFYGMLFAVPLGVLGAMYTSSLMHPRMRRYIKPAFEIMGSLPTVVIGFLAALWLAPLVRASLTAFLLMLGFLPLTVIAGMALY
ncbi:MAG: ABC transporter permease, partial [Gammaproteobacteria bacterium]|nr:ABC transporter permease [Gammaproteobacteria bacterium]NIR97374.1 ABC transporter permease [Gammaproteobacteria bacterium]